MFHRPYSVTTVTEGNELDGSFYLTYSCEKRVTTATADVTLGNAVIELSVSTAVAGDTLRVNKITGLNGTDWKYFMISEVNGSSVTVESAADVDFAGSGYVAEFGDFYSGPGKEYGVSTGCLQADPDSTNNPLDHDVSALDLQDELQGLAQVNSAANCLQVIYSK